MNPLASARGAEQSLSSLGKPCAPTPRTTVVPSVWKKEMGRPPCRGLTDGGRVSVGSVPLVAQRHSPHSRLTWPSTPINFFKHGVFKKVGLLTFSECENPTFFRQERLRRYARVHQKTRVFLGGSAALQKGISSPVPHPDPTVLGPYHRLEL